MNGRQVLDKLRARRDAAKALAVALQVRYRRFLETADDPDTNAMATADLAQCMYENIEFIMWALKSTGGMNPPPPEILKPISRQHVPPPANDPVAKPSPVLAKCTCEPLEPGLLFRDKHMTSCPHFVP